MLKSLVAVKKEKPLLFQVLLLRNDDNEDVEVQEGKFREGGKAFGAWRLGFYHKQELAEVSAAQR